VRDIPVLIVSSEIEGFAKTGGLADVSSALPKELRKQGVDARAIMPMYRTTRTYIKKMNCHITTSYDIAVPVGSELKQGKLHECFFNDAMFYFIENDEYFDRNGIYGEDDRDYPDNLQRFTFFNRAVLEGCKLLNWKPELFHCMDWYTALIPIYLKTVYLHDLYFTGCTTVFTIHNIAFQGIFYPDEIKITGLDHTLYSMEKLEFFSKINLMKGAIVYSTLITTVSRTYAHEIQTSEHGFGLQDVLHERSNDVHGIVNGIDYQLWNPEHDAYLEQDGFTADSIEKKEECKKALLRECGLSYTQGIPLISFIGRFSHQRGIDIIIEALPTMIRENVQCIILGTGDSVTEKRLQCLAEQFPENICLRMEFNEGLAHRIIAGSDMFLMPSRFEPCGLTQLYSLRYGTIPIVHHTGGLVDTVFDYATKDAQPDTVNGFSFKGFSIHDLLEALQRAVAVYRNEPEEWKHLMLNSMRHDWSWAASAQKYIAVYKKAMQKHR